MKLLLIDDSHRIVEGLRADAGAKRSVVRELQQLPRLDWVIAQDFNAMLLGWEHAGTPVSSWLRSLRQAGCDAVIVAMLRAGHAAEMLAAADAGVDDCLVQPLDAGEAWARLRLGQRRRQRAGTGSLRIGDVQIDRADGRAQRAGQPVELTAREWQLLHALVVRPGRTVPRGELEALLSERGTIAASNRLEVHIANLRRKLGPGLIDTKRGLGYRIAS